MFVHALSLLLVFTMVSFREALVFLNFFCFCFMSNKYYWMPLNFRRFLFSVNKILFIDDKRKQWNLNTQVKVFHESISCFMKYPRNCISWNCLKEKFHSVSLPLWSYISRDLSQQFWCLLDSTKNSIFYLSFQTQSS